MTGFIIILMGIGSALLCRYFFWRLSNLPVRLLGTLGSAVFAGLFVVIGVVYLAGVNRLNQTLNNPPSTLTAATTPDRLARGERLANLCASCHSTTGNPPLDGSKVNLLDSPDGSSLGTLYAPNLTPAGGIKTWTDGEIIRAIREGVGKDGKPLLLMPSEVFHNMSDEDVTALVGYLRTQRAVDHPTPPRDINFIGILLLGAGQLPTAAQSPITDRVTIPPLGATSEYGRYIVGISGCQACHGADLAGGTPTQHGHPTGPNLTVSVTQWSESEFLRTIRTGNNPGGHALNPEMMPWKEFSAAYTDDELKAIYAYIHGLSPIRK